VDAVVSARFGDRDHSAACIFCASAYGNRSLVGVILAIRPLSGTTSDLMVTYVFGPGTEHGYELLHVAAGRVSSEVVVSDCKLHDLLSEEPPDTVEWGPAATKGGSLARAGACREMFLGHLAGGLVPV
jgi:hypothetical protein